MKKGRLKKQKINLFLKLTIALMFVSGALIFLYPFVVDSINNFVDQMRITQERNEIEQASKEEKQKQLERMRKANKKNTVNIPGAGSFSDPFLDEASSTGDLSESYYKEHIIGTIFIPDIQVSLPLYDETNEQLLEKGATVLQGTSYPIGGTNSHSVITGHSGLTDKKLFTDLDQLQKKKSQFYIHIGDEKLAYEVKKITKVKPDETDKLQIQKGKDLVTLLTCTPYGVNSHRLLVTGERIAYPEQAVKAISKVQNYHRWRVVALGLLCLLLILLLAYWIKRSIKKYQLKKRAIQRRKRRKRRAAKRKVLEKVRT